MIKISTQERNSHMINLVAFSDSDRTALCKAILGENPLTTKQHTNTFDLDYADWLPERLLGSKINAGFWNWGTKISVLIPMQVRPPSKRNSFIQWQRINTAFLFVISLIMLGILFLGSSIISLVSLTSTEPVTGGKILIILVINCLIAYASLSMVLGTYGRMKLLKRIKEDRTRA